MMELMQGLPDNILGIVGSGTITRKATIHTDSCKEGQTAKAQEDSNDLPIEQGFCSLLA
jgi:hypothetical protein